jgi:hypothetical protein
MFIGISGTGRVYTLDRSTGAATPLAAQTGRLVVPTGTAFDFGNGELTSEMGQRIRIHTSADWSEYLLPPYAQPGTRLVATGGNQPHAFGGNVVTEEVVVDAATDQVYAVRRSASPPALLLVGSLGVDTSDAAGLANAVHVPDHVTHYPLYAALTVDGVPGLYLLDDAGHAALIGAIGSAPITSLTTDRQVLQVTGPPPAVGLVASFPEANTTLTITLWRTGDDTIPVNTMSG